MLSLGRCLLEATVERVMMIDSLEMTDADRAVIAARCREAPESRIAITHGTDTMVETAAYLGRSIEGKTIVLTGAMVPYKFGSSDGLFNLGSALAFVQILAAGRLRGHEWPGLPLGPRPQEPGTRDLRAGAATALLPVSRKAAKTQRNTLRS